MASGQGADVRMAAGGNDASVWNFALHFWIDDCLVGHGCCTGWSMESSESEGIFFIPEMFLSQELY